MINKVIEFKHVFTEIDIKKFIEITEDDNPIHLKEKIAQKQGFKTNIVHGMLTASLFSTLVGKYYKALYLSQTIKFHEPVYLHQKLIIRGKIIHQTNLGILKIKTEILDKEKKFILVDGEANIKLLLIK